jgi:hypothetical protein
MKTKQQLRIIHSADNASTEERIHFLEEDKFDENPYDYVPPTYRLLNDFIVELDYIPDTFPSNHEFKVL